MTNFPGVLFLLLMLGVAGCSSPQQSQPPPSMPSIPSSSPIPSSAPPSMPGTPSGSPSTPSTPSASPPSPPSESQGQSGQSMPSGGTPGAPGGSSGEQTAGNESSNGEGEGDSDQNQEGSENEEDPGNDGWDTSNQMPGDEEGNKTAGSEEGAEGSSSSQGEPGEDGELNGAFEDFDGAILEERELILAKANENAGSRDREAEEPLPEIPGAADGSEAGNSGQSPGGNIPLPPRSGTPTANTGVANVPVGDLPKDLPDARDDDILARQLREAAMSEPDPELREKLWTEYRRYKNGL